MATLAYQISEETNKQDGTKYRTYHLRSRVTEDGEFESFEHGRYFMASIGNKENRDSKGILPLICAIDGVYSASAHDYQLGVKIGQMLDWEKDTIHEAILEILSDKLAV